MKIETIKNDRLNNTIRCFTHKSGLRVKMCALEDFKSTYAIISAKYGSADNCFKTADDAEFTKVPDGIAHFLEHKLFQNEDDVNAFDLFSKTGANANAYTSFDKTAYLFSCTSRFRENLEILLGFVTKPYFTEESVQKELGIIGQEIQMYNDDPDWNVYFNALDCMYVNNPVKVDIAGTEESIAKITPELLYRCYNAFYDLRNMVLAVVGNFDEKEVIEVCDAILQEKPPLNVQKAAVFEPKNINHSYKQQKLDVSMPHFQLGFKLDDRGEQNNEFDSVLCEILLDVIAGESSPLYRKLYDSGLINDAFGSETFAGRDYLAYIFGGESNDPKKVRELILQEIERIRNEGINEKLFTACKKALYGRYVRIFDKPSALAAFIVSCDFAGVKIYDIIDRVASATVKDLMDIIDRTDANNMVLSVVNPY